MKTIIKLGFLFLTVAFAACQKDGINSETRTVGDISITIVDGWIESPEWLASEVERVANQYQPTPVTGKPTYPLVYSVKYDGENYIYIMDIFNSLYLPGKMYFTLSGNLVDSEMEVGSNLCNALEEARKNNGVLLWKEPLNSRSNTTRAI